MGLGGIVTSLKNNEASGFDRCPVCGTHNTWLLDIQVEDDVAYAYMTCNECDSYWSSLFKFYEIADVHNEEGDELADFN